MWELGPDRRVLLPLVRQGEVLLHNTPHVAEQATLLSLPNCQVGLAPEVVVRVMELHQAVTLFELGGELLCCNFGSELKLGPLWSNPGRIS